MDHIENKGSIIGKDRQLGRGDRHKVKEEQDPGRMSWNPCWVLTTLSSNFNDAGLLAIKSVRFTMERYTNLTKDSGGRGGLLGAAGALSTPAAPHQ